MILRLDCALLVISSYVIFLYQVNAYAQFPDVLNHLGVRTPYRFKSNKHDAVVEYPGCKPKKIWMVIRHGTRFPKMIYVNEMKTTLRDLKFEILLQHKLGKGNLTKDCLASLEDWSAQVDSKKEMGLAPEGEREMVALAERMKKRFPTIFKNKYDNKTFLIRYTATRRTQDSAEQFVKGLFSQKDCKDVLFSPAMKVDTVMRFYKYCDKWLKQVMKNPDTYKEFRAFEITQHMNKTLESISNRLGLSKPLSLEQLRIMFVTCGFETAWNKYDLSPWCEMIDKESAEVLEYYFDLKDYWRNGYGLELTYRQACLAIKTMFENLSDVNSPKAMLFFAHSGTILKIISHLGLYRPATHLTADELVKDRAWKTTDIDCFASNLAFVLFGCPDRDYVLAMHQEHVIRIPPCETDLCPLERLVRHYHDSIHNCDFDDMCRLSDKLEL